MRSAEGDPLPPCLLFKHPLGIFPEFQSAACAVDDFQCNSEATKNFVKKTASGDAALGIKPYDPLIIDTLTSNRVDGVVAEFKNINVTGLRNQNLTEIK